MTQKQVLASLREQAAPLNCTVSVRRNAYGEYEARIRQNGNPILGTYHAGCFEDAADTLLACLNKLRREAEAEARKAEAQARSLFAQALHDGQCLLNAVGCRLEVDPLDMVTLISPKTGRHGLNMAVRPLNEFYAHLTGFVAAQLR